MGKKVLLIGNDTVRLDVAGTYIARRGHSVEIFRYSDCINGIPRTLPDLVVYHLYRDDIEFVRRLHSTYPCSKLIVLARGYRIQDFAGQYPDVQFLPSDEIKLGQLAEFIK